MPRYPESTAIPARETPAPPAICRSMMLVWESGRNPITCLSPPGSVSVEKNVLQRKDIGMIT